MGTSLTGLTPSTTYDALIKVGDNGPLSATAKVLSDGLGNDSPLAMSTDAVAIGTTNLGYGTLGVFNASNSLLGIGNSTSYAQLQQNGSDLYINTNLGAGAGGNLIFRFGGSSTEYARITNAGNVGIGTTGPNGKLHISNSDTNNTYPSTASINVSNFDGGAFGRTMGVNFSVGSGSNSEIISGVYGIYTGYGSSVAGALSFVTNNGSSALAEKARITSDGYLRMAVGTGGIQFNGDTSASNALDDYEEGTWTPVISFGSASTGINYTVNQGYYTKIGRQVTLTCYILLNNKGSATGVAKIEGLPFTINSSSRGYSAPSFGALNAITFSGQFQGYGNTGTSTIDLVTTTLLGIQTAISNTDFTNATQIIMNFSYFV